MSFLSEKRHKYSNFYNTNKEYYLWFEDFPTPAFLRFSSVDMYISTLFISDGQYLSIADKYRNETKEKQRQRMKQVWIFLAINLIWVIFCIFLFIEVIPPPSNADTSNKNPSPEYIEMLKDIRDRRAQ